GNDGTVGPERRADVAVEPTVVAALLAGCGRVGLEPRQARESLGVRGRGRAGPAAAIVQGHARPGSRAAVAHSRHPHHALFHADPRVHPEIRDLHDRGWLALRPRLSVYGVGDRKSVV